MAEFEELIIKVEVKGQQDYKEQSEQLKSDFRDMHTTSEESFGRLFRHTGNIGKQVRQLTEGVTSGDAGKAIGNFASTFGRAGLTIGGIIGTVTAAMGVASAKAQSLIDLDAQAKRAGIHPAQLMKDIETAALSGLSRERMVEMDISFGQRIGQLKAGLPEVRQQILNLVTMEGDPDPSIRAMVNNNVNEVLNSTRPGGLNAVKEFIERIKKHYEELGHPEFGAKIADAVLSWWGLDGIEQVTEKFKEVDEESKKNMDSMIEAAKAWALVTGGMKNDFEAVITMLSAMIMEDPLLGPLMRGTIWLLGKVKDVAGDEFVKTGELPWWMPWPGDIFKPLGPVTGIPLRGIQHWWRGGRKRQEEKGATEPQRLMSGEFQKQADHTEELVREFTRLNALLSGQEQPLRDLNAELGLNDIGKGNPPFHNQPMGGAAGESNPIRIPDTVPQPGGGAPAEAREPLLRPYRAGDVSRGTYGKDKKQIPILSAAATPLPPQFPGETTYTGVSAGKGVASWFGRDPRFQQKDDPSDPYGSNALRVPERYQGISLSTGKSGELGTSGQSLGQWHYWTNPETGLTYLTQQTDVGPGRRTQKLVDVSAALASTAETGTGQTGYTKKTFEAMQEKVEKGELPPAEVQPGSLGTYGRPGFEGKDITAPMVKGVDPKTETQNIYELDTKKLLNPSLDYRPDYAGGGPRADVPEGLKGASRTVGESAFGGAGAFDVSGSEWTPPPTGPEEGLGKGLRIPKSEILLASTEAAPPATMPTALMSTEFDRTTLDRSLSDNIEPQGNLDVNVKAPAGTEVKADGDGMFKGNVSLDRQMELPTLQ